jgi:hypothetical protein
MIKKTICVLGLSLLVASTANAAAKTLKAGSLFCASEEAFDTQMKYLADDVQEYAPGCASTNKDYKVVILDLNLLSATSVKVIENGLTVWIAHESLK